MTNNRPIAFDYTDAKLRILVEEYITMQRKDFTFKGVCSFVLYRAMEEERTVGAGLYESDLLSPADCDRVRVILEKIVHEGRLSLAGEDCYTIITN